jgi:hypothetical protein
MPKQDKERSRDLAELTMPVTGLSKNHSTAIFV